MILGTTIGEGCAIVYASYHIDEDGDLTVESVEYRRIDIMDALDSAAIDALETECAAHYKKESEQSKTDAVIAKFESDKE